MQNNRNQRNQNTMQYYALNLQRHCNHCWIIIAQRPYKQCPFNEELCLVCATAIAIKYEQTEYLLLNNVESYTQCHRDLRSGYRFSLIISIEKLNRHNAMLKNPQV